MEVVIIAAALPLLAEIILWITYYIGIDKKILRKFSNIFKALADAGKEAEGCKKENIAFFDAVIKNGSPERFTKSWQMMKRNVSCYYDGFYIPNAHNFFSMETVKIEAKRDLFRAITNSFWPFAALCLLLPAAAALLFDIELTTAFVYGSASVIFVLTGHLVFLFLDAKEMLRAETQFRRFTEIFDSVLPVADKNTALLHEVIKKNQTAFESGVDKIVNKFDGFAELTVLPALKEAMSLIADLQENGMKKLAEEFSVHLTDTLDVRMTSLSETILGIEKGLNVLQHDLSENTERLNQLLIVQRTTLEEAARRLYLTGEQQMKAAERNEQLQQQVFASSEALAVQIEQLKQISDTIAEQNQRFGRTAAEMIHNSTLTQKFTAQQLESAQLRIQETVDECVSLFDGTQAKMKEAMSEAGVQIAAGIKETTGENAEAIAKIIEQSRIFNEEYDNYFVRMENYTAAANEDMDYHVSSIISRISEAVQKLLDDNLQTSLTTLNDYKQSTSSLLEAFREQTASISLYAKEINMDINELSENLKTSVSAFSSDMKLSVETTLNDFDSGLAELTLRIANTVESICDAVETLPEAIKSTELN